MRERAASTIVKLTSSLHYPADYTDQDSLMVISEHQAAYLLGKRIIGQKVVSTYTPCQPLSIIRFGVVGKCRSEFNLLALLISWLCHCFHVYNMITQDAPFALRLREPTINIFSSIPIIRGNFSRMIRRLVTLLKSTQQHSILAGCYRALRMMTSANPTLTDVLKPSTSSSQS